MSQLRRRRPGVLTAVQEKGPKLVTAADCDNNVDRAFRDVYHFLLIKDKDVRSGSEVLFDNPLSREFS